MKENQAMEESKTANKFIISDMETLRVIADPLRAQMMEILVNQELTIKQVADRLGLTPGKLYYHANQLEKHGLIYITETRQVANMLEKVYKATAPSLDVDPNLLNFTTDQGKESINTLLTSMLDNTKEDLQRSLQARAFNLERGASPQPRQAIINRLINRMTGEQAEKFAERVMELLKEFDKADAGENSDIAGLQPYALTIAYYPSYFFEEIEENTKAPGEQQP
jgi:DNA-binding transcriptional ArsR family regulator